LIDRYKNFKVAVGMALLPTDGLEYVWIQNINIVTCVKTLETYVMQSLLHTQGKIFRFYWGRFEDWQRRLKTLKHLQKQKERKL
jgi:hypothetical protein